MAKILFPNCYPAEMIINLCGCTTEIKINHEPKIIDFGVLDSRENVKSLLKLYNPSLLDFEISLKSFPSQVWSPLIKENAKINSKSSIEIPFYFKEKKEGKFTGFISLNLILNKDETKDTDLDQSKISLKLKSETNVKIPLKATIVDSPIKFNKNLNFGIISHHVLKEDTILMQNTFSDECDFVFASPDSQNIKITIFPTNGKLFKGQTKAVYISASLLLNEQPLKLYEGHDIEMPNMELAQKPLQNEDAIPDLNLKRHTKSHRRSSVMERRQSVSLRKESDNGGDKQLENLKVENNTENLSSSNIKLTIPCYLDFIDQVGERQTSCFPVHVSFKIQNPSFKLSFSKNPIKNNVLDFGVIPCSTRIIESLTIENLSNDPQTLGVVPLNPLGPFEMVNANRTIPPLSKFTLKISYFPSTMTRDLDELFLQINQDENIRLYLTGAAIQGSYQIEVDNNLVSFGDVAVSDTVEKQINIRNTCNAFLKGTFSIINVQIKSKENEKEKKDKEKKENLEDQSSNENGSSLNVTTFSLEAKSFEIEPNSLKPFIIKMTPNQDKCEYEGDLEIKIDGCQSSVVKLKGKSSKKDKAKHK
ncbi:hypothetical protein O9G_005266 [Rozella allomycis CSF55]|uniref:Uncharacterized protein n=1 Tax=Rozella allomycis (strain CSF55) TaxID=988480 RepID=A0A075AUQ8_ROZAC|nr:hypothetical protein O9G_005266 [Rozella allomycis CSF55]|eukprot:EPZ34021.1 hypothetical protein O9G_005266 [Rozella allomycis CSF55]